LKSSFPFVFVFDYEQCARGPCCVLIIPQSTTQGPPRNISQKFLAKNFIFMTYFLVLGEKKISLAVQRGQRQGSD